MANIQVGAKSSEDPAAPKLDQKTKPPFPGRVPHVRPGVHGPKKTRSPFQRFCYVGKSEVQGRLKPLSSWALWTAERPSPAMKGTGFSPYINYATQTRLSPLRERIPLSPRASPAISDLQRCRAADNFDVLFRDLEGPQGRLETAAKLNAGSNGKEIYIQVLLYEIKMHGISISMNIAPLTSPQGAVVRGIVGQTGALPAPRPT
jgi:hypothetical protein